MSAKTFEVCTHFIKTSIFSESLTRWCLSLALETYLDGYLHFYTHIHSSYDSEDDTYGSVACNRITIIIINRRERKKTVQT